MFPLNLYARVRFFVQFAHETAGAARTRSSLRPLTLSEGANEIAKLGRGVSRECEGVSAPSAVIPGRAQRELRCAIAHLRIHTHDRGYGFRACAKGRIPE